MLKPGIYEKLINEILRLEINSTPHLRPDISTIEKDELSGILSRYITNILADVLRQLQDKKDGSRKQLELINRIVEIIEDHSDEYTSHTLVLREPLEKLMGLVSPEASSSILSGGRHIRPETSIAVTSLFTASENEPNLVDEFKNEIKSSNRISMLVSFIRFSGIRLLLESLRTFTQNGGKLRILTTSYMGATDPKAIEELSKLQNTEIKVSYDTQRTRLHAKAYVFHRETGFSTAYVGSSNISNVAMSTGLEWNVKLTKQDLPEALNKVEATFEGYWNSSEFEIYTSEDKKRLVEAIRSQQHRKEEDTPKFFFDIKPYPYQQEILDKLEAEREIMNNNRNLIVAATGTGKTVIAALDYKRFCDYNVGKRNRLLFIAHREEILKQSIDTFRHILKNYNFGEVYAGGQRTDELDFLFITIQSLNSQRLIDKTPPDFYDFIVVDEFHHACAKSYKELISYYKPKIFLGLTATPERSDGVNVAKYFEDHISAEIRLPEAIDRKLLSPFQYFGITDTVDLKDVIWRGGGYDENALNNLYVTKKEIAEKRASMIVTSLHKYMADFDEVKGLGFCVSVEHAKFMASYFTEHGIKSTFLVGGSPDSERSTAKDRLVSGEIKFIFAVDIYNEGVDIPEINTILFLRPTKSLTVFLQQLGRGLRLSDGKDCLTVLDFIGQANNKYDFEEKFASLLYNTNKGIQKQIETGFVHLPRGSYIELEPKAKENILNNIRRSFGVRSGLRERIATFKEDTGLELTLENFLTHYHLKPLDIYAKDSFSRLCVEAGKYEPFNFDEENKLAKALQRISAIDSRRWIELLRRVLKEPEIIKSSSISEREKRMLSMFHYTVWKESFPTSEIERYAEGIEKIRSCNPIYNEILELLDYNLSRIDFIDEPVDLGFESPVDLHCTYSKDQILLAMDSMNPEQIREGVKYLQDKNIDLLFVTLNKSEKEYSPTTLYDDYSISEKFFHWQSQSTTSESSETGQRYMSHKARGTRVLLFVRDYKKTMAGGGSPYSFLGLANYVTHEGSRPMSIIWELEKPIPAKYIKQTNKLLVE